MASYDVGQIVYIVSSAKMQVLPFVVAEEVVRKTLDGKQVTYLVKRDATDKTYNLSSIEGDVFTSIDEVRSALIENATSAVSKICTKAEENANRLGGNPKNHASSKPIEDNRKVPTEEDIKRFILDDGTRVHVNVNDI